MHKSAAHVTSSILQAGNYILQSCGYAGYNNWTGLWVFSGFTHTRPTSPWSMHGKAIGFIPGFTRLCINLCTVFCQLFCNFISVTSGFVHIFHSAYKENGNLKKGIIL